MIFCVEIKWDNENVVEPVPMFYQILQKVNWPARRVWSLGYSHKI